MLTGSMVAVVTPMDSDGSVNYRDFARVIDFHVSEGTEALVVAGTTGESATLDHDEHVELLERACELAAGRIPIVAGTGSNSTTQTLNLSRAVDGLPIAAFLVVTPYYNKPPQEGMRRHFCGGRGCGAPPRHPVQRAGPHGRRLEARDGREARELTANIAGIKEATGELARVRVLRETCGEDFVLLSGDDATSREFMLQGGDGVISVTGNVAPAGMRQPVRRGSGRSSCRGRADRRRASSACIKSCSARAIRFQSSGRSSRWGSSAPAFVLPLLRLAPQYHAAVSDAMLAAGVRVAAA